MKLGSKKEPVKKVSFAPKKQVDEQKTILEFKSAPAVPKIATLPITPK